ncbi:MAG: UDP-N-acetylmuramoyl-tripeptide--D-alanyl-D-alanine ligase [Candidatus Thioglobus sp.]|nr:UDP-N-acetylmuramoyl-tripeptide--D-alanyl-D-alanine ligase [Candidatus Thioglobus sp.]
MLHTNCKQNVVCKSIQTDSRKALDGAVFLALIGDNFDGHNYIKQAEKNGAVAIISSQKVTSNLPILQVKNTQIALAEIAKYHRQKIKPKVVAITGSNGKTTTKNMLANILNLQAPTLKTQGNFNNHLGVPMTLLKLNSKHQFAVIEMGANHIGEIAYLRAIAEPDIAVVTNTLDAHIGEFGGFENLVKTKGEIYHKNSTNIVNTQTSFSGDISFGAGGNVFATNRKNNQFELNIKAEKISVKLQLLGQHNIENALAASACAYVLGIDIKIIKQGLEATNAEKSRLDLIEKNGLKIIDDSYNASPSSSKYALKVLANFGGERVAILGQMAELGSHSQALHAEVGNYAKSLNINYLYSIGSHAKEYKIQHFNSEKQLLKQLQKHPNATLLFKGSRVAKLEKIIAKL